VGVHGGPGRVNIGRQQLSGIQLLTRIAVLGLIGGGHRHGAHTVLTIAGQRIAGIRCLWCWGGCGRLLAWTRSIESLTYTGRSRSRRRHSSDSHLHHTRKIEVGHVSKDEDHKETYHQIVVEGSHVLIRRLKIP
jgi:hypothetical protein